MPHEPVVASHPLRVLVVDDDVVDRRVVRRHLGTGLPGVEVEESADPSAAAELARTGRFDCVLLDYRFPGGEAFDLFAELLAEPCSTRPPIVLLTGSGDERIAAESIHRGAQGYLGKAGLAPEPLRLAIEGARERARHLIELERRDEELVRLSFQDPLTGLPNRRLFTDRLEQAIRESGRISAPFCVLMMDLNRFKQVNDTLGHEAGDRLLQIVAGRIRSVVRDSDTVARFGGDEFAVILSTAGTLPGALVVAEKISAAVDEPVLLGEQLTQVGVSVGVAGYPSHASGAEELLRHADQALYESKRSGRATTVYSDSCDRGGAGTSIAHGLRGGLAADELFMVYQPQVRLEDGGVVGVEALVRWLHPDLGLLPAGKFIPAAEQSEIIEGLTFRVLEMVAAQQARWREEGLDLRVSVNLSSRLLGRTSVVPGVVDCLDRHGMDPGRLCLEVTETGLMESPDEAMRMLEDLSGLGVSLSIDDFGSGFSSLRYLRDLPVGEIKIDRQFIAGLRDHARDTAVVESVVALGSAFGAAVVAEGIEDPETVVCLQELGCVLGQGFFLGRPASAAAIAALARSSSDAGAEALAPRNGDVP